MDRTGPARQLAPVGAELEGHDDAGDHAQAEGDTEDAEPKVKQALIDGSTGCKRQRLQKSKPRGEPDRERRKNDVKRNGESELDA